jgi:heat shock protein HtpX
MSTRWAVVSNVAKALLVLALLVTGFGLAGWALGGYRLVLVFVACAVFLAASVFWYGERFVLGMLGARELPLAEAPALHSLLDRLSLQARVIRPKAYLLPEGYPRIFVVGRGPESSCIAVSRSLIGALPPAELEGVVAHELAHVSSRDVAVQTIAVVVASTLIELSRIGGFLERALLFVLGPLASAIVHALLSPRREFGADRAAAALVGTPHGLADALIRLEQASELVDFQASPATEPLYTLNPFDPREQLAALFDTHPPVSERVRRLRELDPDWREKLRAA